jgi:hypothetical protein
MLKRIKAAMGNFTSRDRQGKIRYGVAAWLLGLPLPIIIIALFIRGCDW